MSTTDPCRSKLQHLVIKAYYQLCSLNISLGGSSGTKHATHFWQPRTAHTWLLQGFFKVLIMYPCASFNNFPSYKNSLISLRLMKTSSSLTIIHLLTQGLYWPPYKTTRIPKLLGIHSLYLQKFKPWHHLMNIGFFINLLYNLTHSMHPLRPNQGYLRSWDTFKYRGWGLTWLHPALERDPIRVHSLLEKPDQWQ